MKKVKKTDEYSIFQKRSGRYAVRDKDKKWVHGDDKIKLLVAEGLIKLPEPKTTAPMEPQETLEAAASEEVSEEAPAVDASTEAPTEEASQVPPSEKPAEDSAAT